LRSGKIWQDVSELSRDASLVDEAVEAIRAGKPVVLPTDTVYGLCATPHRAAAVEELHRLKGRDEHQPVALLVSEADVLFQCVPELRGRTALLAQALLPGALTLVLPNPAQRFPWLTGGRPETIGVRVPDLAGEAKAILQQVGALAATSANLTGRPDPKSLDEVPEEIRRDAAVLVDGGELPGRPSTVVDLTGPEPKILREGAVPAAEVLERLGQLV
jgi:tRNA threonylcarbamoyl adenosine modification protein (Sua5/YciO/YrdC/YwlC family)